MPPTVHRGWVEGSGPKRTPWGVTARCSTACTVPASTTAVRASGSTASTRFRWREKSSTMPRPIELPAIEVPAPREVSGVPVSRATASAAATSSACRGRTTASGGIR